MSRLQHCTMSEIFHALKRFRNKIWDTSGSDGLMYDMYLYCGILGRI